MARGGKDAAPSETQPLSGVPCTVHPDLRTPAEMHVLWRDWGWRVLGEEPVAETDRAALAEVYRLLLANWGAVYRPVALLPPCLTLHGPDEVRLYNRCLAAGLQLRQHRAPLTVARLAHAVGADEKQIERLMTRILPTLDAASGAATPQEANTTPRGEHL